MLHARKTAGFTLIELLVVISIIALLSSVVLSSLNSARTKALDAKRVSDLREFQSALLLCYDKIGSYTINGETTLTTPCSRESTSDPDFVASWTSLCGEFMRTPPVDPTVGYVIHTSADYKHFALLTQLESRAPMTSAQVTAFLANLDMAGWAQCSNYNYVIGQ